MTPREFAQEVDERIDALERAAYRLAVEEERIVDQIRRNAGQTYDWRRHEWSDTFIPTEITDTVSPYLIDRQAELLAQRAAIRATLAQVYTEIAELAAVYDEERWNRAYLVTNSQGHVHKSRYCSTCFPNTRFAWLTEFSGADETEIVEAAGETACTICYPSAPAEVLNRPTTIVTAEKAAKEAAKAEREAKRVEREAKRLAKAATLSGESLIVPDDWDGNRVDRIDTEYTARREWNSAEDSLGWIFESQPERAARLAERQRLIEEALAEKHGLSAEEMRAELLAKYAKRK